MNFSSFKQRRDFLKTFGSATLAAGIPTLDALSNVAVAAGNINSTEVASDYKAIVCLFLYGGQDHSNILIPYQDGNATGTGPAATNVEFSRYAQARSNFSSSNANGDPATQVPGTGNLAYTRAQLAATALAPTVVNSITGTASPAPGGWTTNTYGRQFALHPQYAELKSIYDSGKLAVIANVGTLVAPLTRAQWYGPSAGKPAQPRNLYSHDDQQRGWMSGMANVTNPSSGIGGRIANHASVVAANLGARVATQVSIDGSNTFMLTPDSPATSAIAYQIGTGSVGRLQTGTCNTSPAYINGNDGLAGRPLSPFCMSGGPVTLNNGYNNNATLKNAFQARINSPVADSSFYSDQWRVTMRQSIDTQTVIAASFISSPPTEDIVAPFITAVGSGSTYNSLAAQLRMVAAMIRASAKLGANDTPMKRQIFFVSMGGFDTHGSEFWTNNPRNCGYISKAISAFWTAMGNIAVTGVPGETARDHVTLFTMSEFGRTLDSNGIGSDHGWGNYQVVLGGAVKGGKIYGNDHNVYSVPSTTPVFMQLDTTAGAVPRVGLPPSPYSGTVRINNQLNHALSRGELLPTTSTDAVVATIAQWFGVPPASIAGAGNVFPTLAAAHPTLAPTDSNNWNMGFMA
jgi:uncharacterized protein (DUF1501 family)